MFWKLLALIVLATTTGSTLLGLRHQQLLFARETMRLHVQIDRSRKRMWDLQTLIAEHLEPVRLRTVIAQAPLELEPIAGTNPPEALRTAALPAPDPLAAEYLSR